jgi:hypothetical protein
MVARMAWTFDITAPIDPATGQETKIKVTYEPTPNARSHPFPANFNIRDDQRLGVLRKEMQEALDNDPLKNGS